MIGKYTNALSAWVRKKAAAVSDWQMFRFSGLQPGDKACVIAKYFASKHEVSFVGGIEIQ